MKDNKFRMSRIAYIVTSDKKKGGCNTTRGRRQKRDMIIRPLFESDESHCFNEVIVTSILFVIVH